MLDACRWIAEDMGEDVNDDVVGIIVNAVEASLRAIVRMAVRLAQHSARASPTIRDVNDVLALYGVQELLGYRPQCPPVYIVRGSMMHIDDQWVDLDDVRGERLVPCPCDHGFAFHWQLYNGALVLGPEVAAPANRGYVGDDNDSEAQVPDSLRDMLMKFQSLDEKYRVELQRVLMSTAAVYVFRHILRLMEWLLKNNQPAERVLWVLESLMRNRVFDMREYGPVVMRLLLLVILTPQIDVRTGDDRIVIRDRAAALLEMVLGRVPELTEESLRLFLDVLRGAAPAQVKLGAIRAIERMGADAHQRVLAHWDDIFSHLDAESVTDEEWDNRVRGELERIRVLTLERGDIGIRDLDMARFAD